MPTMSGPLPTLSIDAYARFALPAPSKLKIMGNGYRELVSIDYATGKVELHGSPNKAARVFWKAVAHTRRELCGRSSR